MGTGTVFNKQGPRARGNLAALVDTRLLRFQPNVVRDLADRDIRMHALTAPRDERTGGGRIARSRSAQVIPSPWPLRERPATFGNTDVWAATFNLG